MRAISMQNIHKDMGMPITHECLNRSANPTKSCLYLHIHECSSDYPLLYNGTTIKDYQKAIFVLTHNNAVTMQELRLEFSQTDTIPQGTTFDPIDNIDDDELSQTDAIPQGTNFDSIDIMDDDKLAVNQSLQALFEEASTPMKKKTHRQNFLF
jgi:hypothetical protein